MWELDAIRRFLTLTRFMTGVRKHPTRGLSSREDELKLSVFNPSLQAVRGFVLLSPSSLKELGVRRVKTPRDVKQDQMSEMTPLGGRLVAWG